MSQFRIEKSDQAGVLTLIFEGQIDEDASFEGYPLTTKEVVLELEKVAAINSCGIREWVKWIKSSTPGSKVVLRNCPKVIVDQINMVAGFLPENGIVDSFYVPYYCESSGNEKMVLFRRGAEFTPGGDLKPPSGIKDEETGEAMEMDVIEAKYFKFLKN